MQREELVILRLPPHLASRLSAKLDDREKKRSAALRRRRAAGKSAGSAKEAIEAVWGEHGAPVNYDSTDESDFLNVIRCVAPDDEEDEDVSMSNNSSSTFVAPGDEDLLVEYWCVSGSDYIVRFGVEQFHATMTRLPCHVEAQKLAGNQCTIYKTGDVGQILIVHPEKVVPGTPRPAGLPRVQPNEFFGDGLTPPMRDVLRERYSKLTPEYRMQAQNIVDKDVQEADERLTEFKDLLITVNAKKRAGQNARASGGGGNQASLLRGSTMFVHEELVEAETWMDYHPDSIITLYKGEDNFEASVKLARRAARQNKALQDERFAEAVAQGPSSHIATTTTTTNNVTRETDHVDDHPPTHSSPSPPPASEGDQLGEDEDDGNDLREDEEEDDMDLDGDILFEDDQIEEEEQGEHPNPEDTPHEEDQEADDRQTRTTKSVEDLLNDSDDDLPMRDGMEGDMV